MDCNCFWLGKTTAEAYARFGSSKTSLSHPPSPFPLSTPSSLLLNVLFTSVNVPRCYMFMLVGVYMISSNMVTRITAANFSSCVVLFCNLK